MGAKLVEEKTGREHPLKPEGTSLGRHNNNDIPLVGRAVSRFHAEIGLGETGWFVEDHGSTYGTFVNGSKVDGVVELAEGDRIRMAVTSNAPEGEFNFVFRVVKDGLTARMKHAALAVVNRRKIELGHMVFERGGKLLLVRMSGIFRRREMDALVAGIARELGGGDMVVVLEMTDVRYMNSYGLACLVRLGTTQKQRGQVLRVFGAAGTVLKLLKMVGTASPIELRSSREDATGST
jgi:anti-anti-sigma factor